jgi:hypothetical protein
MTTDSPFDVLVPEQMGELLRRDADTFERSISVHFFAIGDRQICIVLGSS